MERTSILKGIAVALALFLSVAVFGATHKQRLYQCYLTGNMADWLVVMDELSSEYNRTKSVETLFELTHAQYGYIGYLLGVDDEDRAEKLVAKALINASVLLDKNPKWVEVLAIKGALIAYKIAMSPYKAPFLGPESVSIIDKALSLDSTNPYALTEKANSKLYAPVLFGGNPKEAVLLYQKAIASIERTLNGSKEYEWWHLNVMAQLAIAAENLVKRNLPVHLIEKFFRLPPTLSGCAMSCIPSLQRRMGNSK